MGSLKFIFMPSLAASLSENSAFAFIGLMGLLLAFLLFVLIVRQISRIWAAVDAPSRKTMRRNFDDGEIEQTHLDAWSEAGKRVVMPTGEPGEIPKEEPPKKKPRKPFKPDLPDEPSLNLPESFDLDIDDQFKDNDDDLPPDFFEDPEQDPDKPA